MLTRAVIWWDRLLSRVEVIGLAISSIIVFYLMFQTSIDALGRYLFNSPLPYAYQLTELAFMIASFAGLAFVQKHREHITVSFLMDRLSGAIQRTVQAIVDIIALALFAALAYRAWPAFVNALVTGEIHGETPIIWLQRWPSRFFVFAGAVFICLELVTQIVKGMVLTKSRVDYDGK